MRARRRSARLAVAATLALYALIVLGGVVRITGAGMACGEDWPLCRGRFLPTPDLATLLEYFHRLAAAAGTLLVLAVVLHATLHRREPGFGGRGGLLRPAALAAVLLLGQILLGAVVVRFSLPPAVVTIHLGTAMLILGALLLAAVRAYLPSGSVGLAAPGGDPSPSGLRSIQRTSVGAAALGFVVVVIGALVANTGAGPLCQGFPLCGGKLFPPGGGLVHLHWTHRVLAYLLALHVMGAVVGTWRRPAPRSVRYAATAALALVAGQIAVAALLVLGGLSDGARALHLAAGTAVWAALFLWAALARVAIPAPPPAPAAASHR